MWLFFLLFYIPSSNATDIDIKNMWNDSYNVSWDYWSWKIRSFVSNYYWWKVFDELWNIVTSITDWNYTQFYWDNYFSFKFLNWDFLFIPLFINTSNSTTFYNTYRAVYYYDYSTDVVYVQSMSTSWNWFYCHHNISVWFVDWKLLIQPNKDWTSSSNCPTTNEWFLYYVDPNFPPTFNWPWSFLKSYTWSITPSDTIKFWYNRLWLETSYQVSNNSMIYNSLWTITTMTCSEDYDWICNFNYNTDSSISVNNFKYFWNWIDSSVLSLSYTNSWSSIENYSSYYYNNSNSDSYLWKFILSSSFNPFEYNFINYDSISDVPNKIDTTFILNNNWNSDIYFLSWSYLFVRTTSDPFSNNNWVYTWWGTTWWGTTWWTSVNSVWIQDWWILTSSWNTLSLLWFTTDFSWHFTGILEDLSSWTYVNWQNSYNFWTWINSNIDITDFVLGDWISYKFTLYADNDSNSLFDPLPSSSYLFNTANHVINTWYYSIDKNWFTLNDFIINLWWEISFNVHNVNNDTFEFKWYISYTWSNLKQSIFVNENFQPDNDYIIFSQLSVPWMPDLDLPIYKFHSVSISWLFWECNSNSSDTLYISWISNFFACSSQVISKWLDNISSALSSIKFFFEALGSIWNTSVHKTLDQAFNFDFILSANATETYVYQESQDPLHIISSWSFDDIPLLKNSYNLVKYILLFWIMITLILYFFKPKENG